MRISDWSSDVCSSDLPPEHFAHAPAGNLLMQDRPGPTRLKGNRLLMEGDRHYDYDAFGNLIRERRGKAQCLVSEYRYDSQHRLISVTTAAGRETSYRYDAFGRRNRKTVEIGRASWRERGCQEVEILGGADT